jgi:ABC-type glycerol-3-phosphate transport system permease component
MVNYMEVVSSPKMIKYFINSLFIAGCATGICIILSIFAGYGFARYDFPGKRSLLSYVLYTMVLPRAVIIVPLYLLLVKMKAQGTYQGLIFTYLVIALPLAMWLFSVFFNTIPVEIEDAARIDGCNTAQLLWKIAVPLVKPCIFAVFMYSFVLCWNEYLLALVFSSPEVAPVTVGLVSYAGEIRVEWGRIMAAACLMTIPTIVFFNVFAKYLASGLVAGATKG